MHHDGAAIRDVPDLIEVDKVRVERRGRKFETHEMMKRSAFTFLLDVILRPRRVSRRIAGLTGNAELTDPLMMQDGPTLLEALLESRTPLACLTQSQGRDEPHEAWFA